MKILLTAFEPFGGESINPSREAAARVTAPEGVELVRLDIPVVFSRVPGAIREALRREQPDAVVCVGQAGGRAALTVERVGINVMDARIPDNEGSQPVDMPVVPDGPVAYFSTLPIRQIVAALRSRGLPAAVSNTAGTYTCNQLLYTTLHELAQEGRSIPAGFLHVPYLPAQTAEKPDTASMSLENMISGIECLLGVLAESE